MKLPINDIELFYEIKGTGEPLLLISGLSNNHSSWSLLLPSLTQEYQVIYLDNRGAGQTSAPDYPYTIQQMANDAAQLLEKIGIDKVHIVGHSMGGQIAQEFAIAYPEKTLSLILLSTWSQGDTHFHHVIESWGDIYGKVEMELYYKIVLPWIFSHNFYAMPKVINQLIAWGINYPWQPTIHGVYHQSRAILNNNTRERLVNIHCPTLVWVCQQDILTPVTFSEQLAQGIPNAKLSVFEGGSHGCLIELPDVVSSVILDFLGNLSK